MPLKKPYVLLPAGVESVVGKAFVISWPLSHWSWLDDHPDVFRGVEREDA